MKFTKYMFNFPHEATKQILLYNAFSGALALIESEKWETVKYWQLHGIDNSDPDLISDLQRGSFIHADSVDELQELKLRLFSGRFSSNGFGITIAPTSNCNFRCPYCYEKDVLTDCSMTQDVQDAVIQFIKQKIGTSKSLGVTWYGGEPTLALDVIEYISANLIEYCIDNGLDYSAGIITNGYLLTRETVSLLNKFKVQFYQITLDGNPSVHDSRRYLADGSPTFNTILQNIITCYDILPKVSLRVNIDRTNLDAGAEIAQILKDKGIGDKVTPYLGKVTNENGSSDHLCLSAQEFAKNDFEFISSDVTKSNWSSRYPIPRNNFCGADCLNSFVVGPTGALYKCWNDIGHPNRVVGSLTDSSIKAYRDIMYQYLLFDPTQDSKCRKCKFLPICMGGCPYFRQKQSPDNCYVYRSILEHNIKFAAQQLLNERQKNSDDELI